MSLTNIVLLGMMVMLHLNMYRAAPRPKTYLVETADLEDDIESMEMNRLGTGDIQDGSVRLIYNNICPKRWKGLIRCYNRRGWKTKNCARKREGFERCIVESTQDVNFGSLKIPFNKNCEKRWKGLKRCYNNRGWEKKNCPRKHKGYERCVAEHEQESGGTRVKIDQDNRHCALTFTCHLRRTGSLGYYE